MADFESMSHPERVAYLAGLEVECPGIEIEPGVFSGCDTRNGTLTDCPECHGGGKPRFPMLRKPCLCDDGKVWRYGDYGAKPEPHKACQGRGWVLVLGLEALLNAVAEQKQPITITSRVLDNSGRLWEFAARFKPAGKVAFADDLGSALSLALCRKMEELPHDAPAP